MSKRILVINSEIQKALSQIISFELENPKITGIISVLEVDTAQDLEQCKVKLSVFAPDADKVDVFNEIKHSASYIRKILSQKVNLRRVPYLNFILDNSLEEHTKISELIAKTKLK